MEITHRNSEEFITKIRESLKHAESSSNDIDKYHDFIQILKDAKEACYFTKPGTMNIYTK
jgi:hypothetical protein